MNLIVSVDRDWAIGCGNQLLFHVPEDMSYFRKMTVGKVVVMGLMTFFSLPESKPLKDRVNIVLSDKDLEIKGAVVCRNIEELLEETAKYPPDDVFVIGGQSVYEQLLPSCTRAYVTAFRSHKHADRYFPDLSKDPAWRLVSRSGVRRHEGTDFTFDIYERVV